MPGADVAGYPMQGNPMQNPPMPPGNGPATSAQATSAQGFAGQGFAGQGNGNANPEAFPYGAPTPYTGPPNAGYAAPGAQYTPAAEPAIGLAPALTKKKWVWLPLSFVFLLLGLALGFQAALTYGARPMNLTATDFSLSLAVTRTDQTLTLRWNRELTAIRAAKRGVLEIEEEGISKPVELDAAQLQNGTLIYRNASDDVRFKLSVYPQEGLSISQSTEWRREP